MGMVTSSERGMKPFIKWAGGKRWLAPRLKEFYERSHKIGWCEPCVGAGAAVLHIGPERALLNDANPHLINLYEHIRKGFSSKDIERVQWVNTPTQYLANREIFNSLVGYPEQHTAWAALLFFYLTRTCFNGLVRFNRAGKFNVGYGKYQKIDYAAYLANFSSYTELFRDWQFSYGDFAWLRPQPGAVVYADPPYHGTFTGYSAEDFNYADQVRLALWLEAHDGPVIVSNSATDAMIAIYSDAGYTIEIVDAPRMISCDGDRTPAKELLAWRGL
jgi:DNA adenine methylase